MTVDPAGKVREQLRDLEARLRDSPDGELVVEAADEPETVDLLRLALPLNSSDRRA